ncbi:MAG TPA: acyl-CoA dehydrogenase family protein [Actinoplanes sp.]|nr:acyl-CoA dehydrogenase family protein [Actinoplanes sp.]
MDFRPDETQQAITDLARAVTAAEGTEWAALGQAGLLTLAVPEKLGGAGLGILETAFVLTEIGRRALDVPALSHLAAGVPLVARWGSERQREELLVGPVLGLAVAEPGDPLPAAPRTALATDGTVSGVKTGVIPGDRILVTVDGPGVVVVDPAAAGVHLDDPAGGGRVLRLDRVVAEPLGALEDGPLVHADLHRNAIAGACALGDGALAGALALTADHVREREQFGRPIATFQAVAQQVADVYVTARTLHLVALSAAWRLGTGRDADEELDVAALWFTAEAPAAARTCHHLHGGLGLSIDYPLHRHTALIRDLVRFLGGGEHRLTVLGDRLCTSN